MNRKSLLIAMPTPGFLPNTGGMEVGLHNIATRLARRGHRPRVIIPVSQYRALKESRIETAYRIDPFWPRLSALSEKYPALGLRLYGMFFRQYQARHRPDVWHSTMIYPTGTGLCYALGDRVPALARAAGNDIQINAEADYGIRRDPAVDKIVRAWGAGLPAYVAITQTVWAEYEALGIAPERIFPIPNGVDLARFRIESDRAYIEKTHGIPRDPFMFLSVGRNHTKKNYALLIEAFAALRRQAPELPAILVIAGKDTKLLHKHIAGTDLEGRVFLLENIGMEESGARTIDLPGDELIKLYRSADSFVFPSLVETFGIAIIEAMAAGLPCIISDAPGCRDITAQGAHALAFDPHDASALSRHMLLLMTDGAARALWRQRALARVALYDWDHVVDQYEELYDRLIKGARS